jgi:DME family drug/metabolite transporter
MQYFVMHSLRLGVFFALLAAFLNSTSGIFSKILLEQHAASDIVFAKCLLAFFLSSIWILFSGEWRKTKWNWTHTAKVSLCALFGIGGTYIFEIMAYNNLSAPVVVLCLMGASTITTLFIGHYWLKERLKFLTFLSLLIILAGLYLMTPHTADIGDYAAVIYALISGFCYGMFLLLAKRFDLPATMVTIWLLMGFGSFYLYPLTSGNLVYIFTTTNALIFLLPLAILPTILGYFYTTKALHYAPANTVQFFQVSEPIFSAILAFFILQEFMVPHEYVGATLIIGALLLYSYASRR